MQIFVRTCYGKTLLLNLDPTDTIEDLRAEIVQAYHRAEFILKNKDLRVEVCGQPLRASCRIQDYTRLHDNVTIQACHRNAGGCFVISITLWITIMVCLITSFCTCGLSLFVAAVLLPAACLLPFLCL